jgi:hypothetical protein
LVDLMITHDFIYIYLKKQFLCPNGSIAILEMHDNDSHDGLWPLYERLWWEILSWRKHDHVIIEKITCMILEVFKDQNKQPIEVDFWH